MRIFVLLLASAIVWFLASGAEAAAGPPIQL
jgi:hypothetical protein